jgi:inosose dehydratase
VIRLANAPCSWGVLEFESKSESPGHERVLDEIAASGYIGTELGDWGFMPTDPSALREALERRHLALLGAFVTVRLADASSFGPSLQTAVRTGRLMADVDAASQPFIVLSDEPTADPVRTQTAGRVDPSSGLSGEQWDEAARGVERIARAVRDETGLRTVFHHHAATFVETPDEIAALLDRTDASLLGLCLDSGHITYGGGSPEALLARDPSRVWHLHLKDCSAEVAAQARAQGWDYQTALRHGLFCELGQGVVDFPALLQALQAAGYDGWGVVEQDVLPSMGAPLESAKRNRAYLAGLGL